MLSIKVFQEKISNLGISFNHKYNKVEISLLYGELQYLHDQQLSTVLKHSVLNRNYHYAPLIKDILKYAKELFPKRNFHKQKEDIIQEVSDLPTELNCIKCKDEGILYTNDRNMGYSKRFKCICEAALKVKEHLEVWNDLFEVDFIPKWKINDSLRDVKNITELIEKIYPKNYIENTSQDKKSNLKVIGGELFKNLSNLDKKSLAN